MYFTIGWEKIYDGSLNKGVVKKRGRTEGQYSGGIIFRTPAAARAYIAERRLQGYAIYSVDCSETDVEWRGEDVGLLLFDRQVIAKTDSEEATDDG